MSNQSKSDAKKALDIIIKKSRVHLYKPIQIAEILWRDRVHGDVNLADVETYRNASKKWRDAVSTKLVGRISTSSAKYQDNLFDENAMPPRLLVELGAINRTDAKIEKYIYHRFLERHLQLSHGLAYCNSKGTNDFDLNEFAELFSANPGLKRSVDKVYEIIVYSIFSALVEGLGITVEIGIGDATSPLMREFEDFTTKVLQLNTQELASRIQAKIFRAGVTNAADRGIDMWSNFGLAIQIKYLSLTADLAEAVVEAISADRIIIVCKDSEEKTILSLLNQIGWKAKIQAIVVWSDLEIWYERALRGNFSEQIGVRVLCHLKEQLIKEFPSTDNEVVSAFFAERGYS